jgi:mannosyltransferase OCH1-like enzyme
MIHQILINSTNTLPILPDYIQFCQEQIKKLYPNEEYHLYSGKEIENIIKNNFSKEILTTYHSLKPYAYKADLARYCLLYLYGGLYIDLSLLCLNSLDLQNKNFFAFRDLPDFSDPWWAITNTIIYSKPKSNIMKTAIDLMVYHCKTQFYGTSAIDVGGPTVLGKAIMRSQENFHQVFTNGQVNYINSNNLNIEKETLASFGYDLNKLTGFVLDEDKKIIALRKPSKGGDIKSLGLEGTNNYVNMWLNKDVYDTSIKFTEKLTFMY